MIVSRTTSSMLVTPSFFRVLQTQPLRGQLFTEEQGELGQRVLRVGELRIVNPVGGVEPKAASYCYARHV